MQLPISPDGFTHITTSKTYCTRRASNCGWKVSLPEGYTTNAVKHQHAFILEVLDPTGKRVGYYLG